MKRLPILSGVLLGLLVIGGIPVPPCKAFLQEQETPAGSADPSTRAGASQGTGDRAADASSTTQQATKLLQEARDTLFYRDSVTATLRQTASIGRTQFEASGTYAAGLFPKLRLSYEVKIGQTTGHLLEVCDGQVLWTIQEIQSGQRKEPSVKITRTVIDKVQEAWHDSRDIPETLLIAGLGVGGLPALLAGLERSMTFDEMKVVEHEGQQFTVIQGRWNEDYRARFGGAEGQPLPEYVPDRVRIYFHQDTLFPSRILYLKRASTESELTAPRALLSLEFTDVVLDQPISEEQFRYVPPDGTQVENRTTEYVELIKAAKARAAAGSQTP